MASKHWKPADKSRLEYFDTIVLNGRVEKIRYEDENHCADYIGIRELALVPTFDGYIEKTTGKFAFTPAMEDKIGWRDAAANLKIAFSDAPIDPHEVDKAVIMSYYGEIDKQFDVHWSELSGYLWTDEQFKIGGHSLIDILNSHVGEYCHLELELFRER